MPTVTNPTPTAAESAPAGPESAWTSSRLPVAPPGTWELTTTWPGQVGTGITSAEKRVCQASRRTRTLQFDLTADTPLASWLIRNRLLRMGYCRSLFPTDPDYTGLTAPATTNVLTCDTTLRRFSVGQRVAVGVHGIGAIPYARVEVGTVQSLTATSIPLTVNLSAAHPMSRPTVGSSRRSADRRA